MNSSSSGEWLDRFFSGKGFYIVLFLCAAVIGGSAWMMASGGGSRAEETVEVGNLETGTWQEQQEISPERRDRQTVIWEEPEEIAPVSVPEEPEEEPVQQVFQDETPPVNPNYAWPLQGEVGRFHDPETLRYDETLGDWRTHQGIDILAPLGETVLAAHAGRVESVVCSDLMGTVVTVSHGDGYYTVYANLEESPAVREGDWVEPGSVIGAVGTSALSEVSQESHLHFAVMLNGVNCDPLDYLPA